MDWKFLNFCAVLLLCIAGILAQDNESPRSLSRTKLLRSRNLTLASDGKRRRILKSRVLVAKTTTPTPVEEKEELTAELEVAKIEDDADLLTTISRTFETTRKLQTQPFLITDTPIFEEPEPVTPKPTQAPIRKVSTTTTTTTSKPKVKKVTTTTEQPVEEEKKPNVETVRRFSHMNPDGSFTFGYENADGSFKEETRGTDCVVRGKYGYIDPDGVKREFTYVQGIPCVPGQNEDDEDEDDKSEEEVRTSTRRPAKVIKKKRPQQSVREEEEEINQVLFRGQAPLPVPNTEVRRPLIHNPTTRQTSPTVPPTIATEAPMKATPAFTAFRPTTPKPQVDDVRISEERPSIPFRPDPFRQRPVFDLEAEVQRLEQNRPEQPKTLPHLEQARENRPPVSPRPEPFSGPELRRPEQPRGNPVAPPQSEPFRPPQSFSFESELQRIEQGKNNFVSRPAPVSAPELIPEQRFPPAAERPRESAKVREQPNVSTPPPARPEPVLRPVTTTTTPRPTVTSTTPRTTPVVITTTPSSKTLTASPRTPAQLPSQSSDRPPFTFFGQVPPEFHQFGPPTSRPNPVETRPLNNRPNIPFRPEPQFNFLPRPDESAFPPRDQRTQDPRFNEAFRPDFPPPPPHFRPLEDPRFSQGIRGEHPHAPPQFRPNTPPQFRAEERPQEIQRQPSRPEDPRQGRPEDPRQVTAPNSQGERIPPFAPPQAFPPQQPRFGPPPPFTNFGPQQDPRFAGPQDPRFSERPEQPRFERPPQQATSPSQQRPQPFQGERASAARGQIDQFLG